VRDEGGAGPRVLLTGASGFLGAHVVRALLARGVAVTALVRPGSDLWRLAEGPSALASADLSDAEAVARVLADVRPEVVCDLAWHGVGNRFHDDPAQVSANLRPHLDLLQAAAHAGCRRWIGLGSQAEYGPQAARIDEGCATRPSTVYGAVKLAVGVVGQRLAARAGMEFVWLRLFSCYGPMDAPGWLIPSVTLTLLRCARPKLTAGTQKWDYLFVEDAARAVAEAALATRMEGVYNLGSGRGVPVREIVEAIRDLVDPALPLGFGEVPYGPHQIMHLEADVTKLCEAIPWRPATGLEDGLRRTVAWYREHRDRYPG
jgi:nucleoside-diphosphate-sugar epimerase